MANVIFLQNIKGVAQIGDVKKVADGYARNFLFPRKLAVLATEAALRTVESLKEKRLIALEKDKETTRSLAEKLQEFTLKIERAASEEGTLYDGLDAAEVSSYLKKNQFNLEPETVLLQEPIKKVGEYSVEVDLGYEIKTTLKIEVKKLED
ncbi:MAG: 50S ribosomal protein L9 [bacterium]|nr:50S ribosomal protein L9 [bacterium]